MQLTIERDLLAEALNKIIGIIDAKSGVDILKNVRLDVCAQAVLLTAADTNMHLTVPCPAEVKQQGQITVDGKTFNEVVRKCAKAGMIDLAIGAKGRRRKASSEDRLQIASGKAQFDLLTLSPDKWPLPEMLADVAAFSLECRQLRAMIDKTLFAVSRDETRYYLQGIYLHADGENLIAVATDGHRLSQVRVPLPAGADDMPRPPTEQQNPGPRAADDGLSVMPGVIIPRDAAMAALKILPDSEVECELACDTRLFRLRVGEVELVSRLIDGTFPDYRKVIPTVPIGRVIAPREALSQAVARVGAVLDEKDSCVRLDIGTEEIGFSCRSSKGHSAAETVEECNGDVAELAIGFNARYFAELLDALDAAQIAILMHGTGGEPLLFEEVDGDGNLRMVLMPMRLPGKATAPERKKAA